MNIKVEQQDVPFIQPEIIKHETIKHEEEEEEFKSKDFNSDSDTINDTIKEEEEEVVVVEDEGKVMITRSDQERINDLFLLVTPNHIPPTSYLPTRFGTENVRHDPRLSAAMNRRMRKLRHPPPIIKHDCLVTVWSKSSDSQNHDSKSSMWFVSDVLSSGKIIRLQSCHHLEPRILIAKWRCTKLIGHWVISTLDGQVLSNYSIEVLGSL